MSSAVPVTRFLRPAVIAAIALTAIFASTIEAQSDRWNADPVASSAGCASLDHGEIEQFLARYLYPALAYSGSQQDSVALIPIHYAMATTLVLRAQICLAEALELKDLAFKLQEQVALLTSGTSMSRHQIKKQRELTDEANAEIDQATARLDELSPERRRLFARGTVAYLGGTYATWRVFNSIQQFVSDTKDELNEATKEEGHAGRKLAKFASGAFGRAKLTKDVSPVLGGLHEHTRNLYQTSRLLIDYADRQKIEIPTDATDQLAELSDWV